MQNQKLRLGGQMPSANKALKLEREVIFNQTNTTQKASRVMMQSTPVISAVRVEVSRCVVIDSSMQSICDKVMSCDVMRCQQ
jgi:hypothetical protein